MASIANLLKESINPNSTKLVQKTGQGPIRLIQMYKSLLVAQHRRPEELVRQRPSHGPSRR